MRRAVLVVTFASCGGLFLLSLVGLALVWLSEVNTLVLPDAADMHIEQSSLSRQHITYRLPLNQTPDDLYEQLIQAGWARDVRGELGRLRDQRGVDAFVVFWRQLVGSGAGVSDGAPCNARPARVGHPTESLLRARLVDALPLIRSSRQCHVPRLRRGRVRPTRPDSRHTRAESRQRREIAHQAVRARELLALPVQQKWLQAIG
jgi:hypothetical protein